MQKLQTLYKIDTTGKLREWTMVIEDEKNEGSFVSLAKKFAEANNLMFFPEGLPSSWIRKLEDGSYKQFKVLPNDKNIDKICELWLDDWNTSRDKIEQIMEKA